MSAPTVTAARWIWAAGALFAVAWGGNEFTPLLVMYKLNGGMTPVVLNLLLGAYVLGIIPAMLLGGPLSDRYGRRPLMLPAPLFGIAGSAILASGASHPAVLATGRVFSGLALGLVMAVGTSWIKELSSPPFEHGATPGTGARRAAMSLTIGFGLGAIVAAALAQYGPWPNELPYVVNIVVTAGAGVALLRAPETRRRSTRSARLIDDLRIPAAGHRRFLLVVAPTAPWVFGTAACAYAILPALLSARVANHAIVFAGVLCLVALGSGFAIQTLGRRFDRPDSARGVLVGLAVTVPGMLLAALTALTTSLALSLVAAAVLGVGYGLLIVGGLQEVQRIAGPDDLAGLTAVYYSLCYLGFFVPAMLAGLTGWFTYPAMLIGGAVIAAASILAVLAADRHPSTRTLTPAGR